MGWKEGRGHLWGAQKGQYGLSAERAIVGALNGTVPARSERDPSEKRGTDVATAQQGVKEGGCVTCLPMALTPSSRSALRSDMKK